MLYKFLEVWLSCSDVMFLLLKKQMCFAHLDHIIITLSSVLIDKFVPWTKKKDNLVDVLIGVYMLL